MPSDFVLLLMHYLRNQTAKITWDGEHGDYHRIDMGVRQGGISYPILIKLYINDLISEIFNMDIGCCLSSLRMKIVAYADDIVILSSRVQHLESLYEVLVNSVERLKLEINKTKSKCVIFERARHALHND